MLHSDQESLQGTSLLLELPEDEQSHQDCGGRESPQSGVPGVRQGGRGQVAGAHPGLAGVLHRMSRHHVRGQLVTLLLTQNPTPT